MCDCITCTYIFGLRVNNVSLNFGQDQMAILLGLCLRLLGNNRNSDSVHRYVVHIFWDILAAFGELAFVSSTFKLFVDKLISTGSLTSSYIYENSNPCMGEGVC